MQKFLDIITNVPSEISLTDERDREKLERLAEHIVFDWPDEEQIEKIEDELGNQDMQSQIFTLLALKLAKSKILAKRITEPIKVSIIFAVYKEHNRIKSNKEHPHGENFLLEKIRQLDWLFEDQELVDWELLIVDDGCPENSGYIAQEIINQHRLQDKARVLFLDKAINENHPAVKSIHSTTESQKGGSIIYGMWELTKNPGDHNHIVAYTDADLSTHLGQIMLLVDPLINSNKLAAIGSRREKTSVVIKKGKRNTRGLLFIYLVKRLIPNLSSIIDTQCGFKAFKAEIVPQIIDNMVEKKFAFDIELLLKTECIRKDSIEKVPIAWIDSEAASTTTDLQPYLPMLKSIVKMNQRYFSAEIENEFVPFINALTLDSFNYILDHLPDELINTSPEEYAAFDKIRVSDLIS